MPNKIKIDQEELKAGLKSKDYQKNKSTNSGDFPTHDKCPVKDASNCKISDGTSKTHHASKIAYLKETSKLIGKHMGNKTENLELSGKFIKKEKGPVTCLTPTRIAPNRACKTTNYKEIAGIPKDIGKKPTTDPDLSGKNEEKDNECLILSDGKKEKFKAIANRFTPNRVFKSKSIHSKEIVQIPEKDASISKIPTFSDEVGFSTIRCTPDRACKSKPLNLKQAATDSEKAIGKSSDNKTLSEQEMKKLKHVPTRFTPNRACKIKPIRFEETRLGNDIEIPGQGADGDVQMLTSSMENLKIRKNSNLKLNKQKAKNGLTVPQDQDEGKYLKDIRRPFVEKSENKQFHGTSSKKSDDLKKIPSNAGTKFFKENSDYVSNF